MQRELAAEQRELEKRHRLALAEQQQQHLRVQVRSACFWPLSRYLNGCDVRQSSAAVAPVVVTVEGLMRVCGLGHLYPAFADYGVDLLDDLKFVGPVRFVFWSVFASMLTWPRTQG